MEPNYSLLNYVIGFGPFIAYYIGIFIRKKAMPGENSPPLKIQFLLGVPVSLIVVPPFMVVLYQTLNNLPSLLITVGIIVEHGMLVNETATAQLKRLGARIRQTSESS